MSTPETAAAPAPVEEVKPVEAAAPAAEPIPVVEAPKVEEPVAAVGLCCLCCLYTLLIDMSTRR